jgi:hypothetical protein
LNLRFNQTWQRQEAEYLLAELLLARVHQELNLPLAARFGPSRRFKTS